MADLIYNRSLDTWLEEYPLIGDMMELKEVFWPNSRHLKSEQLPKLAIGLDEIMEAEARLERFAGFLSREFKELEESQGIIESPLSKIDSMAGELKLKGKLYLKEDNMLPVAGSIKARGGIYEVLKYTEDLALKEGLIKKGEDYGALSSQESKDFFSNYTIQVGSTGNLGLSIGIISAKIGYKVIVHMSSDAAKWKKDLLRQKSVKVVEYESDYSKAVEEGRKQSDLDPRSYFVDDEKSMDLFLGYTVAGLRLKRQIRDMGLEPDREHPIYVYLPCGVGGGPGGIAYSLRLIFGDAVRLFFAEPTHSPCMLLSIYTNTGDRLSVGDFKIDNKTIADGLAVGRASDFISRNLLHILDGLYSLDDSRLSSYQSMLYKSQGIYLEPSACAGFYGLEKIQEENYFSDKLENISHIVWATGGSLVPDEIRKKELGL